MNNQKLENGLYARIDWLEFTVTELDPNKNNEFRVSIRKALGTYEESEYDNCKGTPQL